MDSNQMNQNNTDYMAQTPQGGTYTAGSDPYQQNAYGYNGGQGYYTAPQRELEEPISVMEWILTNLIVCIPCINIIMMFLWAFSKTEKKSKSNYFKAQLIVLAVVYGLMAIVAVVLALSAVTGNLSI